MTAKADSTFSAFVHLCSPASVQCEIASMTIRMHLQLLIANKAGMILLILILMLILVHILSEVSCLDIFSFVEGSYV